MTRSTSETTSMPSCMLHDGDAGATGAVDQRSSGVLAKRNGGAACWRSGAATEWSGPKEVSSMLKRVAVFGFGVVSYAAFFASFLYAIGFVGGFGVPTTLDGVPIPSGHAAGGVGPALAVDALLLALFAAQHSVMA